MKTTSTGAPFNHPCGGTPSQLLHLPFLTIPHVLFPLRGTQVGSLVRYPGYPILDIIMAGFVFYYFPLLVFTKRLPPPSPAFGGYTYSVRVSLRLAAPPAKQLPPTQSPLETFHLSYRLAFSHSPGAVHCARPLMTIPPLWLLTFPLCPPEVVE